MNPTTTKPPIILNNLKPIIGKPKPRMRSNTTRTIFHTNMLAANPDLFIPSKVLSNKSTIVNIHKLDKMNSEIKPDDDVENDNQLNKNTNSKLRRFVKRFSETFLTNDISHATAMNEPKSATPFGFNNWRRRRSTSRINYSADGRDRSPMNNTNNAMLNKSIESNNSTIRSIDELSLTSETIHLYTDDKQRGMNENSTTTTCINQKTNNHNEKRRLSLTKWITQNRRTLTETKSARKVHILNPLQPSNLEMRCGVQNQITDSDMSNTVDTLRIVVPSSKMLHMKGRYSEIRRNKGFSTVSSNDTVLKPKTQNEPNMKTKEDNSDIKYKNVLQTDDSEFIIPPTGIDGPRFSIGTESSSTSSCATTTISDTKTTVTDFDIDNSRSHNNIDEWNKDCVTPTDSNQKFYSLHLPRRVKHKRLPIPLEFLSRSDDLMTNGGDMNTSENKDNLLIEIAQQQEDEEIEKKEDLDLSRFSVGSITDSNNSNCGLMPDPYKLQHITRWSNQLRKSMCKASEQKIRLAGMTLFNRNPKEGIQYLIKQNIINREPSSIANFLMNECDLNRQAIGEYFGLLNDELANKALREFLLMVDMKDLDVDMALRATMSHFHPSGESQKISFLMQVFKEVYAIQNPNMINKLFRSVETIEILAYSVLLLQTDLHNPNVGRLGKRMTKQDFVHNNRGIDADENLPQELLEAIYDRVSQNEFRTLPDPSDRLRALDGILVGPLKTEHFVQRHRRFIGWFYVQQIEKIAPKRSPGRSNARWRYLLIFNDILLLVKTISNARLRSSSLLNSAAAAALGEQTPNPYSTSRVQSSIERNSTTGQTKRRVSGLFNTEVVQNQTYSTDLLSHRFAYEVRNVWPTMGLQVLIYESQYYHFGVQLCNLNGPVINLNMPSEECRHQLIDWLHKSIAEMKELQQCRKQDTTSEPEIIS